MKNTMFPNLAEMGNPDTDFFGIRYSTDAEIRNRYKYRYRIFGISVLIPIPNTKSRRIQYFLVFINIMLKHY